MSLLPQYTIIIPQILQYLFGSFDEKGRKKSCRRKRQLWSYLAILAEKLVHTELNNGAAGNDSDKSILVIHHGNEILSAGPVY